MAKEIENNELRTTQAYNKFLKLLNEKDYAGMARYAIDIHKKILNDPSYEAEREGFEMICQKMTEYDKSPEAGDKDYKEKRLAILNFGREIKKIHADAQLKIGPMVEEWKDKIKNGEVEELYYKQNDETFVSHAANDIVVYQTDPGAELSSAVQTSLTFQTIITQDPRFKKELRENKEFQSITHHTSKSPFILDYIKTKDIPYDEAVKYVTKYETPTEKLKGSGFEIDAKHKIEGNGKPVFSAIPEYIKKISEAKTIEDLEDIKKTHLDNVNQANAYFNYAMQIAEKSRKAWEEINGKLPQDLRTDKYKKFRSALRIAKTIGTDDFEIELSNKSVPFSAIFTYYTQPAVKELADASREYMQELDDGLSDEDKNNPYMVPLLKALKDITLQSNSIEKEMEALAKVLPKENIEEYSKKEKQIINEIDLSIEVKGVTAFDLMKKNHAEIRKSALDNLDECINDIAAADVNVYNGSKVYNDAWKALSNLSAQISGYNNMVDTIIEQGDHNSFIRMKSNRESARKNITDYLSIKAKKKKLSPKTQKRVDAMKKALKALDDIEEIMDKSEIDIDVRNMQKERDALKLRSEDKDISPEEKMAIKVASDSINKMARLLCNNTELLNSDDKQNVRNSIAAITIMERKLYSRTGQLTEEQYIEQIEKLAKDPDFIKATEKMMNKKDIVSICLDTKNGAVNVLNDFYDVKNAAFDTPKTAAAKAVKNAAKNNTKNTNSGNNKSEKNVTAKNPSIN